MSLTLGLTGMDPATETALKAAFAEANARLGGQWRLAPEADADHIVVDMDSMYGPMSWLRLHAAGKHVVGLTSSPRTQTEFRLGRPFDSHQVAHLLTEIARSVDIDLEAGDQAPAPAAAAASAPAAPVAAGAAAVTTPAEEAMVPQAPVAAAEPPPQAPPPEAAPPVAIEPEPAPPAEPEPPPRDPVFADWLVPGALPGRVRYRRPSGPTLLIDPKAQTWHGPTPLKPLSAYFDGTVHATDFEPVDAATWDAESGALGAAQPLARLHWLGGLLAGQGTLLPGNDPDGRYVLGKWPQTEREYPRHFRIATAMMKGPATLAEIAEASGAPLADVADFINANLTTGFAAHVPEPPPEPTEPPRSAGLLGRLRNR